MHVTEILDPDAPPVASSEAPVVESVYFVFRLGALVYALPPGVVDLVAPEQRAVPVPTVPAHVLGVVYVSGRLAALVDLARLLGLEGARSGDPGARRLVLVSVDGMSFAFVADETLGLWSHAGRPTPAEAADPLVRGRFEQAGQAVALLEPAALARRAAGDGGAA